jgi:hypothetical protein
MKALVAVVPTAVTLSAQAASSPPFDDRAELPADN